jgi:hypothetical protein
MANRLQDFIESIVYAGMKPGSRPAQGASTAKPGLLARLLNGPVHSDPLYLTNQTLGQKTRRILFLASPVILVMAIGLVALFLFGPKTIKAPKAPTAAEVRARVLPDFDKEFKLDSNKDLEVTEVHFEHNGDNVIVGNIRNTSNHQIIQATVTFDVADPSHSDLGGVTVTEINLSPGAIRAFKQPIEQTNAMYALVREVATR